LSAPSTSRRPGASSGSPRLRFARASAADAGAVAALLADAASALTARHGPGPWSGSPSERGVLAVMRRGAGVWCAYRGRTLAGTWALRRRKPWAIDLRYFSPAPRRPCYLTGMAVAPALQGRGVGRRCLERALAVAQAAGTDAVRLDAFAGAGGAGGFYRRCGFREVGRASYRGTPHVYFERLLPAPSGRVLTVGPTHLK
jgi:ribosomal protein S18 acetylase RimI-like enzyme